MPRRELANGLPVRRTSHLRSNVQALCRCGENLAAVCRNRVHGGAHLLQRQVLAARRGEPRILPHRKILRMTITGIRDRKIEN